MRDLIKGIIFLIFYFFNFLAIQAQNNSGFLKTIGTSMYDHPMGMTIGYQGDIVLCGTRGINNNSFNQATVYLLDSLGNIKTDKTFNSFNYLYKIALANSGYTFFGYNIHDHIPHESELVVLKTDYNLNFIDSFHVSLMDTLMIMSAKTIIDSKGDYITTGYFMNEFYNSITPFIYKINDNGVINESKIGLYNGFVQGFNIRIIEDFDKTGYYLFDQMHNGSSIILHLDSNLNLSGSGSIDMPNNTQVTYDAAKVGLNRLFYLSKGPNLDQYYAVCLDTLNKIQYFKELGNPQQRDFVYDGLSVYENYLFITSISFPDQNNLYFPNDTNSIKVIKLDTAFNIQWSKNIGWDAYFLVPNIHATNDGGCLVMGSVYDKDTMSFQHDIVLFKLDASGNVTGTHRIENAAGQSLRTYPNPGEDYFNMDIPFAEGEIQVFDQNSKLLFSRTAKPGRNRVDMSRYASGIYFVRLRDDNDQLMGTGKWIKR